MQQMTTNRLKPDAIKMLNNPRIIDLVIFELQKNIVGEADALKALVLVALGGRLVENAKPTSTNVIINSKSGSGKDYIMNALKELLPEELYEYYTRISPKTIDYLHCNEKDFTWDGMILMLEDVGNDVLNSDSVKVMTSGYGNKTKIVRECKVQSLAVNGKPVLIVTSASVIPSFESLRRYIFLRINETKIQTHNIKKKIAVEEKEDDEANYYNPAVSLAIGMLSRVKVKVPWAEAIHDAFPDELISRTVFPRFLDFVRFSTALHQRQRDKSNGNLIATLEDYENAVQVFNKVNVSGMIPVSRDEQTVLDAIKEGIDARELQAITGFSKNKTYRLIDSLREKKIVKARTYQQEGTGRPKMVFGLHPETGNVVLPEPAILWEKCRKMGIIIQRANIKDKVQARSDIIPINPNYSQLKDNPIIKKFNGKHPWKKLFEEGSE